MGASSIMEGTGFMLLLILFSILNYVMILDKRKIKYDFDTSDWFCQFIVLITEDDDEKKIAQIQVTITEGRNLKKGKFI